MLELIQKSVNYFLNAPYITSGWNRSDVMCEVLEHPLLNDLALLKP